MEQIRGRHTNMVVVTHARPHADEALAVALLILYGDIDMPTLTFQTYSPTHGYVLRRHILIGVGGGQFDEHPRPGEEQQAPSAAALVAEHLKVSQRMELRPLLKNVSDGDSYGDSDRFSITRVLGDVGYCAPHDVAMRTMVRVFLSIIETESRRLEHSRGTLRYINRDVIVTGNEAIITAAQLRGDWRGAGRTLARSNNHVVIVHRDDPSLGTVQIYTRDTPNGRADMASVIQALRAAEFKLSSGLELTGERMTRLAREHGTIDCVPEWNWHVPTQSISNGSATHPYVRPTGLSEQQIWEAVIHGLKQTIWPNEDAILRPAEEG